MKITVELYDADLFGPAGQTEIIATIIRKVAEGVGAKENVDLTRADNPPVRTYRGDGYDSYRKALSSDPSPVRKFRDWETGLYPSHWPQSSISRKEFIEKVTDTGGVVYNPTPYSTVITGIDNPSPVLSEEARIELDRLKEQVAKLKAEEEIKKAQDEIKKQGAVLDFNKLPKSSTGNRVIDDATDKAIRLFREDFCDEAHTKVLTPEPTPTQTPEEQREQELDRIEVECGKRRRKNWGRDLYYEGMNPNIRSCRHEAVLEFEYQEKLRAYEEKAAADRASEQSDSQGVHESAGTVGQHAVRSESDYTTGNASSNDLYPGKGFGTG